MKNRAVIYARISREDSEKNNSSENGKSIENQIKILTNYANENALKISKKYVDVGYSGGTFNRPFFNEMIKDLKKKKFDVILIKDFSRLGRVMHKVGYLVENLFPSSGIRLISVNDNFDSLHSKNDDLIVLKYFFNDYYLKEFKTKQKKLRDFYAKTKHLNYYPKYGYNFDENKKEIIDGYSSNVVKMIFNCIAFKNFSLNKVAQILNENGVLTRSNYATKILNLKPLNKVSANKWNAQKVWEIATDYEYCGHSLNLIKNKENKILIKNTHLKIIDEKLFYLARKNLQKRSKISNKLEHLGKIIIDRKSGKNLYFSCNYKNKSNYYFKREKGLLVYKIDSNLIKEILIKDVINLVISLDFQNEFLYDFYKINFFNNEDFSKTILQDKLDLLNQDYEKILKSRFLNKIDENTFLKEGNYYCNEINKTELLLEKTYKRQLQIKEFEYKFKKYISNLNAKIFNDKLIKSLIEKIYVEKRTNNNEVELTIVYE